MSQSEMKIRIMEFLAEGLSVAQIVELLNRLYGVHERPATSLTMRMYFRVNGI